MARNGGNVLSLAFVLASAGPFAACQQSSSSPPPTVAQGPLGAAVDGGRAPAKVVPLAGSWITDCIPGTSSAGINTLTFTDTTMTLASAVYLDVGCTQLSTTVTTTSGYVLGDASTVVASAKNLDVTPQKATLTIHDQSTVNSAATGSLYGYTTWAVDQPLDISGRTTSGQAGAAAKPFYTLVENDGNKLYMGQKKAQTDDNTTTAGRDSQLNTLLTFFHK